MIIESTPAKIGRIDKEAREIHGVASANFSS